MLCLTPCMCAAGVIGQQPKLAPGQMFIYHSGAILPCPSGQMLGHFHFVDASSGTPEAFDAVILPFKLLAPASYHTDSNVESKFGA